MHRPRVILGVAAATLAAAAYAVLPAAPASAAGCPSADGVTVVVDFHELGGGVRTACVADGGGDTASSLFPAAGFPLTYVQRQPGFVCRVSGAPADDPCVNTPPADAYWGLWWSNGRSGSWAYATTSAGSLKVPEGGYVAFSWNGTSARSTPGASPTPHPAADPTPSQAATHAPTQAPSHTGSGTGPSPHATGASPSGSPGTTGGSAPSAGAPDGASTGASRRSGAGDRHRKPGASTSPSPKATDTPAPSDPSSDPASTVSSEAAEPADDGLPTWVAPAVIVVLFGAAGAVALARRRGAGRP